MKLEVYRKTLWLTKLCLLVFQTILSYMCFDVVYAVSQRLPIKCTDLFWFWLSLYAQTCNFSIPILESLISQYKSRKLLFLEHAQQVFSWSRMFDVWLRSSHIVMEAAWKIESYTLINQITSVVGIMKLLLSNFVKFWKSCSCIQT